MIIKNIDFDKLTPEDFNIKEKRDKLFNTIFSETAADDQAAMKIEAKKKAKDFKVFTYGDFDKVYKGFKEEKLRERRQAALAMNKDDNTTNFEGQPVKLYSGVYICENRKDDEDFKYQQGVSILQYSKFTEENILIEVCPHPILLTEIYTNIKTNEQKVKIEYSVDGIWRYIVVPKTTITDRKKIIELSAVGILVTSENSSYLVQYLHTLEVLNSFEIKKYKSTDSMGWFDGMNYFLPYAQDIIFDGEAQYKAQYNALKENGSYVEWLSAIGAELDEARTRIYFASSFASPMLRLSGKLPFFTHIWGTTSTGKTVGIMAAASVWGNPNEGSGMVNRIDGTIVGMNNIAAFSNDIPCFFSEMQLLKNTKRDKDTMIYDLCEGTEKARGQKNGGNRALRSWKCTFLTNGEEALVESKSGAGVYARVVEIELGEKTQLFKNPEHIAGVVRDNYGFAGKMWVEFLQTQDRDEIKGKVDALSKELVKRDIQPKQADSAAVLLITWEYARKLFAFKQTLEIDDILPYLKTKQETDIGKTHFEYIKQFIATNKNRFDEFDSNNNGEIWGKYEYNNKHVFIFTNVFERFCKEYNISSKGFLKWLRDNYRLKHNKNTMKFTKWIGNSTYRVVAINLNDKISDLSSVDEIENLPFNEQ